MKNQTVNNQLHIFEHEDFKQIRVIQIDGQPWFVGKDISEALGYSNTKDAMQKHVDAEDKRILQRSQNATFDIPTRGITIINESGLYSLILSSRLPQAKTFKHWVTSEVLPSIRKYGAYATADTLEEMIRSPKFAESLIDALAEEHAKNIALESQNIALEGRNFELETISLALENRNAALADKVDELKPKARYCDRVLHSGETLPTSVIAKDYGMSAMAFNRLLHEMGIQYRLGTTWLLYQEYAGRGYTKSKTFYTPTGECVVHMYWLHRGRHFLYNMLAAEGIYPLLEAMAIYQEYCEPDFVIQD